MEAVFTGNPVYYVGKIRSLFSPKLRVHIKDNNNSPRGKFHRFLFRGPFSDKFPDLNFAPYVLYINRKWSNKRPLSSKRLLSNKRSLYAAKVLAPV